jgi:hypothetical protein
MEMINHGKVGWIMNTTREMLQASNKLGNDLWGQISADEFAGSEKLMHPQCHIQAITAHSNIIMYATAKHATFVYGYGYCHSVAFSLQANYTYRAAATCP